jgi:MerR family transcriptional regulator, mercuric resistance operon regulatory protein
MMAIGTLSLQTGCNIETIRYYERIGLIPTAARRGRYRSYGQDDVIRLRFIRRARELGFTISQVRALLGIAAAEQQCCDEARAIAASHLAEVRTKISDLMRMENVLAETVRACDLSVRPACAVIETLTSDFGMGEVKPERDARNLL